MTTAASNHNPAFYVDDATLVTGVRAHVELVLACTANMTRLSAARAPGSTGPAHRR
ncbi:hypothetical protein [Sorangium sp. So ce590]|uniref:hypothetical protein n=1 Tax=unclassified Sorangium TaxID=2621164 RepID=UPI003F611B46